MYLLKPFLIALQFLTVLPIRIDESPDAKSMGQSLLYYPLVGLVLGTLLALLSWGLVNAPAPLAASLLLSFWVLSTGALHLDGLADSADAWIGGFGDREKTLAIMKDPRSGPIAVIILVLTVLIKFAAIEHLITTGRWEILVLVPVLGRTLPILLFLTTPYVRQNGMGRELKSHLPRPQSMSVIIVTLIATIVFAGPTTALWLVFCAGGIFIALRSMMMRRLGGTTGDTAGALVEIAEASLLTIAILTA